MFFQADDSPDFPKRDSNDEVHKAQMSIKKTESAAAAVEFEDCIVDFEANPFAGRNGGGPGAGD